jgi:hypothetical protein
LLPARESGRPELRDLEMRSGKRAVGRQADLGQAGPFGISGFGFLDSTEELQPAGDVLVVR